MDYQKKYKKYKAKYLKLKGKVMKGQGRPARTNSLSGYNINSAIKDLIKSEEKPFIIADVELDKDEKNLGEQINVDKKLTYDFMGPIDKKQIQYISKFFQELGNDKKISDKIANMYFKKVISPFLDSLGKDNAWITVRATLPTDEFDLPRWHIDGYYYMPEKYFKKNKGIPKLVAPLKGSCTLLKETDKETREKFKAFRTELMNKGLAVNTNVQFSKGFREELDKFLKDNPTLTCKNDQVVVFVSNLAIHSEPPMNHKRVFLSIVPGDEDEIKDYADNQISFEKSIGKEWSVYGEPTIT